jgi:3-oxoacyl-[acyl-carrier-protein] synthase-1
MTEVYLGAENIITSLGFSTAENTANIESGKTGILIHRDRALFPNPLPLSLVNTAELAVLFNSLEGDSGNSNIPPGFTRLEMMHILSISSVLKSSDVNIQDPRTLIILSTTKGNIDLLEAGRYPHVDPARKYLWNMAEFLRKYFDNPNKPVIVSNACISGILAILTGARLISAGLYDHVIATGGDILSEFVISGFQSFQSLSPGPCKPFDAGRDGLSLGEGCGTILLSRDHSVCGIPDKILITGGSCSNDANHISGPSRTGDGLYLAITNAMSEAGLKPGDIGYISAHGTATEYNDEMEAKALAWAGLQDVDVNSFKGYFGHTLGAAGIIETALTVESMRNNRLFRTIGFEKLGVSKNLKVVETNHDKELTNCLKVASGFGGCNGAIVLTKR